MQIDVSSQIAIAEERLRLAMLASDVAVLEELTSPALIFTNHLGEIFGQQDDVGTGRWQIVAGHSSAVQE